MIKRIKNYVESLYDKFLKKLAIFLLARSKRTLYFMYVIYWHFLVAGVLLLEYVLLIRGKK